MLVSCITLLWIVIFWYSLWTFDGEHRETNTGNQSDTSFLMIPFLIFNEVSKIKFVNILSIKETVLDVTLVGFVIKGMQLTVCYYQVTYEFQSKSTLYSLPECQGTLCLKQVSYAKIRLWNVRISKFLL